MTIAGSPPPSPTASASCARPNLPPQVVTLVRPRGAAKYLERNHKSGIADVKVYLASDGTVVKALIIRSAGDTFLDGATYDAAVATRYQAEIRNCESVEGAYIYRARYNSAPAPAP